MALSTERRGFYSDVALEMRRRALEIFRSTSKVGLSEAIKRRDMGDETAIKRWFGGLELPEEKRKLFWLGLRISDITEYTEQQRKINGEPKGLVDIETETPQGENVAIPVLPAIENK